MSEKGRVKLKALGRMASVETKATGNYKRMHFTFLSFDIGPCTIYSQRLNNKITKSMGYIKNA